MRRQLGRERERGQWQHPPKSRSSPLTQVDERAHACVVRARARALECARRVGCGKWNGDQTDSQSDRGRGARDSLILAPLRIILHIFNPLSKSSRTINSAAA